MQMFDSMTIKLTSNRTHANILEGRSIELPPVITLVNISNRGRSWLKQSLHIFETSRKEYNKAIMAELG